LSNRIRKSIKKTEFALDNAEYIIIYRGVADDLNNILLIEREYMNWTKLINVSAGSQPTAAYVPKWWLEAKGIEPGDNRLKMTINSDGDLVISENDMTPKASDSEIKRSSGNSAKQENNELRA